MINYISEAVFSFLKFGYKMIDKELIVMQSRAV